VFDNAAMDTLPAWQIRAADAGYRFERDVTAHHHASRSARYTFGDVFETPKLMLGELRALLGPTVLPGGRRTTSGQDTWP
jgi:hypothetical protein